MAKRSKRRYLLGFFVFLLVMALAALAARQYYAPRISKLARAEKVLENDLTANRNLLAQCKFTDTAAAQMVFGRAKDQVQFFAGPEAASSTPSGLETSYDVCRKVRIPATIALINKPAEHDTVPVSPPPPTNPVITPAPQKKVTRGKLTNAEICRRYHYLCRR